MSRTYYHVCMYHMYSTFILGADGSRYCYLLVHASRVRAGWHDKMGRRIKSKVWGAAIGINQTSISLRVSCCKVYELRHVDRLFLRKILLSVSTTTDTILVVVWRTA